MSTPGASGARAPSAEVAAVKLGRRPPRVGLDSSSAARRSRPPSLFWSAPDHRIWSRGVVSRLLVPLQEPVRAASMCAGRRLLESPADRPRTSRGSRGSCASGGARLRASRRRRGRWRRRRGRPPPPCRGPPPGQVQSLLVRRGKQRIEAHPHLAEAPRTSFNEDAHPPSGEARRPDRLSRVQVLEHDLLVAAPGSPGSCWSGGAAWKWVQSKSSA